MLSLHMVPLQCLTSLSVVRQESLPQIEDGAPIFETVVDDVVALKPVPQDFVEKMKEAKSLTSFECDWWSWSIADLKIILESCSRLEVCAFDASYDPISEMSIDIENMLECTMFKTSEFHFCICLTS